MSSVDSRIVTMKFDNAQFESGARTSLGTLEKLKQSMNFGTLGNTATKALSGISGIFAKFGVKNPFATAEKGAVDLNKATQTAGTQGIATLEGGVTGVSKSFVAMSTVAITALSNIVSAAGRAGTGMVKALTVDPVTGGLSEYETNLNSIQTILANTKVAGTGLPEVNAALDELNTYSDKTIYNFSEMARNIGTFTAAGVDLDTSVQSIKGIANLAALSGSNSQQASTAMYQLSQEIAAGRVSLMGWNSVVNAGMGGSTFQRALVQTAQEFGNLEGKTVSFTGKMKNATIDGQSFRDSIMAKPGEQSWLSNKVLTSTLAQFTGDMTDAELAAQGFNKEQIKSIQTMAKTAQDAATKVKTMSGVFDTAKEVVGSGWAKTWQLVFGDFKEAREFFTDFSIGFNDILDGISDRRNEVLAQWKIKGGRDLAIEGLKELWESLLTILRPIGDAFRDIFPAKTAGDLMSMTRSFVAFAKNLKISDETAEGLRRTFAGVFAVFSIAGKVISGIAAGVKTMFGAIGDGSGEILSFTGGIGDALVALNDFLEESGLIKEFFTTLGGFLAIPIELLTGVAGLIGKLFTGFDTGTAQQVTGAVDKFGNALEPVEGAGDRIRQVFEKLGDVFKNIGQTIGDALGNIGDLISGAITPETFSGTLDVINTTLLGGIVIMLKRFFSGGLNVDLSGGLFDGVKETLGAATGALQNMQASLKADILLKIAGALALLTASLVVLALIDGKKLAKAMVGVSIGFGLLGGALLILSNAFNFIGAAKIPLISVALLMLSGSILVLSAALAVLAAIDPAALWRGLIAIGALLTIINKAMKPMMANVAGMLRVSASLLILGIALNAMAIALKIFATMSWEEMAKGLIMLAGSLAVIGLTMKLMPTNMPITAAGILILSIAMNALGVALKIFATMSWEEMAKGLVGVAGALVIIAGAMQLMPLSLPITAAGLVLVGIALNAIGAAVKTMSGMGWEEIGKGMVVLAGSLLILAVALNAMGVTGIAGAAALAIAAAALTVLTPVLITLGSLQWETILKSLAMLAGVFLLLGIAGYALAPVVLVIMGLGVAMTLMGAGLALAGVGALAFATAFGVIVATGTAGIQVLGQMLATVIASIPAAMAAFGKGVVAFVKTLGQAGPSFVQAMSKIIGNMLDAVIKNVPKMGRAFLTMLNTALRVIVQASPRIFAAGVKLILGFLNAINKNITKIVNIAASIVVKFINGIANNIGRVIQAGVNFIIKFIEGLSKAIRNNSERLGEAGADLGIAIVEGMIRGIGAMVSKVMDKVADLAGDALDKAGDILGIGSPSKEFAHLGRRSGEGLILGLDQTQGDVGRSAESMGQTAISALAKTMTGINDALNVEADMNPTVTPVLDLSQLTREATRMSSILATSPIDTSVSYGQASDIAMETAAAQEAAWEMLNAPSEAREIKLEQNNYSPKAIDAVTTYRNTKSLLSLAKEALD